MSDEIRRLLDEWDAEVREHGLWTSGHSIAARMAAILRSVGPSPVKQERQETSCWHGHKQRVVGCVSCVLVFDCPAASPSVASEPPRKKRHDRSCPAYGNYQPPYEECNCGYESANE